MLPSGNILFSWEFACEASNPMEFGIWLQEKLRLKAEKEATEAKYKYAMVDGRKEQVRHTYDSIQSFPRV